MARKIVFGLALAWCMGPVAAGEAKDGLVFHEAARMGMQAFALLWGPCGMEREILSVGGGGPGPTPPAEVERDCLRSLLAVEKTLEREDDRRAMRSRVHVWLAQIYTGNRQHTEAERHLKEALEFAEGIKRTGNVLPAEVRVELGNNAHAQGHEAEAERYYKQALVLMENAYGPQGEDLLDVLYPMEEFYGDTKRRREARAIAERIDRILAVVDADADGDD